MMHRQTDYSKGDAERISNRKSYGDRIEAIFGKKELPREFKRFSKVYGQKDVSRETFYVPNMTPTFNAGLGCVTYGTRDAEQKAKKLGKIPIGDARIDQVFSKPKDNTEAILADGMARVRAMKARM